jgi:hypothetical protein
MRLRSAGLPLLVILGMLFTPLAASRLRFDLSGAL